MLTKPFINTKLESSYELHSIPARKGATGRPSGGFLFGWKRSSSNYAIIDTSDHHVLIYDTNYNFFFFFMYISPSNIYSNVLSELFQNISQLCSTGKKIVILGDLNGRIGQLSSNDTKRCSLDCCTNSRGKILHNNIIDSGLYIGNGYIPGDESGSFTFTSESVSGSSVVDLLLYSPPVIPFILKFEVLSLSYSDHFPVAVTLAICDKSSNLSTSKLSSKKLVLPTDLNQQHTFIQRFNASLMEINTEVDVDQFNTALTTAITRVFSDLNLVKQPKYIDPRPPWFDRECRDRKYQMKSCLRKFRKNHDPNLSNHYETMYRTAKNAYNTIIKEKKEVFID